MNDRFKLFRPPELKNPSLLVSWNEDVSRISTKVTDYLSRKLAYQRFAEVEPAEFFALGGVAVEDLLRGGGRREVDAERGGLGVVQDEFSRAFDAERLVEISRAHEAFGASESSTWFLERYAGRGA